MAKKLSDDLIHTNTEYVKLRSGQPPGRTPRETPDHQSTGHRGLQLPELEQWTTDELRHAAATLNLDKDIDSLSRDQMIERLLDAGRRHSNRT